MGTNQTNKDHDVKIFLLLSLSFTFSILDTWLNPMNYEALKYAKVWFWWLDSQYIDVDVDVDVDGVDSDNANTSWH